MPAAPDPPGLDELIAELRTVRERGLVRLRHTDLVSLCRAADHSGLISAAGGGPGAVEALLRAAVDNIGGGSLGAAAAATFGLGPGHRDRPAQDRRRAAAAAYHVSVDRFRKHHERIVLEQTAEEILKLYASPMARPGTPGRAELDRQIRLTAQAGGHRFPVTVHTEPVEMLGDVDILVVPENIYLELPQSFKSSVSAAVRRMTAVRNPGGEIVTDTVSDELRAWTRRNGRVGLPVAPGTVVPTTAGPLTGQRIRRIYHAAIAVPVPGTNDYDIQLTAIAAAVRNLFAAARAERETFDPPLASVAFPLLGAGRGGLNPATSLAWLWAALEREFRAHGPWAVHFISPRRPLTQLIVANLTEAGVVLGPLAEISDD